MDIAGVIRLTVHYLNIQVPILSTLPLGASVSRIRPAYVAFPIGQNHYFFYLSKLRLQIRYCL